MADWFEDPSTWLVVILCMVTTILLAIAVYASRYQRVPPDKVLIIYGRPTRVMYTYFEDGKEKTGIKACAFRLIRGGGTFVMPIIERIGWMSLETTAFELKVPGVRTKDDVAVTVSLLAQFKLKADDVSLRAAAETILEKSQAEIAELSRKILESHVKMTLSGMALAEIRADLKAATVKVGVDATGDYQRSGLTLATLALTDIMEEKVVGIRLGPDIQAGDLLKVVTSSKGELTLEKVKSGVEG